MRLQVVGKLGIRDRIALGLLRAPEQSDGPDGGQGTFRALAASARDRGAIILDPDNAYVGRHELCLLGLLAIHQREQACATFGIDPVLRDRVVACSTYLKANDLVLDHATAIRFFEVADAALVTDVRPVRHRSHDAATARPCRVSAPVRNALQLRALEYVRAHLQVTASDLRRIGVSRQVASRMVGRGLIRRLRFGVYGIVPDTLHA